MLFAGSLRAAPCGRPDLIETFPLDGAIGIPVNASLSARYAQSAEYLEEEVTLEHVGVGAEMATVNFNANEGILSLTPSAPLAANEPYRIAWPALRGLTTAELGSSATVNFTTGSTRDTSAPNFAGLLSVDWDVERVTDDCTDSAEDRFVFNLGLAPASDDGSIGLLALVVFQSAGVAGGGSPEQILVQRFPATSTTVQVRRAIDSAAGNVCFAALARDSLGQVSSSADRQVCTKTVKPPFFYGCTVSRSGGSSTGLYFFALFVAALALRSNRGRRARG